MVSAGSQIQERHRASGLEFQINLTQTKGSGMIWKNWTKRSQAQARHIPAVSAS